MAQDEGQAGFLLTSELGIGKGNLTLCLQEIWTEDK